MGRVAASLCSAMTRCNGMRAGVFVSLCTINALDGGALWICGWDGLGWDGMMCFFFVDVYRLLSEC